MTNYVMRLAWTLSTYVKEADTNAVLGDWMVSCTECKTSMQMRWRWSTSSTNSMRVISDFSVLLFKNWFSFLSSLIDFVIWMFPEKKADNFRIKFMQTAYTSVNMACEHMQLLNKTISCTFSISCLNVSKTSLLFNNASWKIKA